MAFQQMMPEGRLINTHENTSAIKETASKKKALQEQQILEGMVLKCDRDLVMTVALGDQIGIVPKCEAAIGMEDGSTKDIAIISRVGKPISFFIKEIKDDAAILSRRAAQLATKDYYLKNLSEGDILEATVTHLEPFGAFIDIGCGLTAMISIENISSARIPHPSERLSVGQHIFAAVKHIDYDLGRFTMTHKELLGTWADNAKEFQQGETVPGIVRSIKPYGAFVELLPNLSGLTEPFDGIEEGDFVSVYIKAIIPEKRKIKLVIINKLEGSPTKNYASYYKTEGNISDWKY